MSCSRCSKPITSGQCRGCGICWDCQSGLCTEGYPVSCNRCDKCSDCCDRGCYRIKGITVDIKSECQGCGESKSPNELHAYFGGYNSTALASRKYPLKRHHGILCDSCLRREMYPSYDYADYYTPDEG